MNKLTLGIIIGTALLFVGTIALAWNMNDTPQVEANSDASAVVATRTFDWGQIGINDGTVEHEFEIQNTGSQTLKLFNVKTSCMCTTAQLLSDSAQSGIFGMHTQSNQVFELAPGQTGRLKVVFDPNYHGPSGVGPITRQIDVTTNDPDNSQLTFVVTANVVK